MDELIRLERKIKRERQARKSAEAIMEKKALELYEANENLRRLNEDLEQEVEKRSRELKVSEEKYRILVEEANDIFYNITTEGKFTYMNAAGLIQSGYSLDEISGTIFTDLIEKSHRGAAIRHYLKVIGERVEKDYYEFPVVNKHGNVAWVGQNISKMQESDGTIYYSGIARDITKRKHAEIELNKVKKALEASEIKYRSIIENMALGLLELNSQREITKAYPAFCKLVGYSEAELLGRIPEEILKTESTGKRGDQTQSDGVYEVKMQKKSGEIIWVLISRAPFYDINGEVIGSIAIHYDITKMKNLQHDLIKAREVAEKAQTAQKQFLASMSHEIRTPINAIVGMSHLLGDTSLNPEQNELLSIIKSSTKILQALISDILDLSKIESGNVEVEPALFNLHDLITSVTKVFKVKSETKGLSFESQVGDSVPAMIVGDELMINQVLLNLINNAVKFTNRGSVTFSVEELSRDKNMTELEFRVKDTGIGMTKQELEIVFDQFKQASRNIQKEYGGTGLGLSITRQLIQLMGGDIKVESIPAKGSEFYFTLKLEIGKSITKAAPQKPLQGMKPLELDLPVLIVEDNIMNQKYVTRLLDKWGIEYDVANNGKEGVDLAMENEYSMVLMDILMPVMDGFQASRLIRLDNESIPIVALSASTHLSKKEEVRRYGINDFLSKPFTPDQLSKKLSQVLEIMEETNNMNEEWFSFNEKLDTAYLESFYGEDLDYASEMFEIFLENIPEDVIALIDVTKEKNYEDIYRLAHKIKPTFSMVGLTKVNEELETLESFGSKKEDFDVKEWLSILNRIKDVDIELIRSEKKRLEQSMLNRKM